MDKMHRDILIKVFLFLIFFLFSFSLLGDPPEESSSKYFFAEFPHGEKKAEEAFLDLAERAREELNRRAPFPLEEPVRIVYCSTQKDFLFRSGMKPEHYLASASAKNRTIYINGEFLRTREPEESFSVLLHEYAHVYLGLTAPEPLPHWLNEGLAMHLARDWSVFDTIRLSLAHVFKKTIPLSRLEAGFPQDPSAIPLAYLQSYSLTDYIIKRSSAKGDLSAFLNQLTDPREGRRILEYLQDPIIRDSLEHQWKKQLGGWWRNAVLILTSGSVLWFVLASLFLFAYVKKRQQKKRQIKIWEEEERDYPFF